MDNKKNTYNGLALVLFEKMQQDNIEYIYRGEFNTGITDSILNLAETNLDNSKDGKKTRKRVYFILVEGLQNITRHQEEVENTDDIPGLLIIQRKSYDYVITTGNLIKSESVEHLKGLLEKINSLDKKELKEYYRTILSSRTFSAKGGAGLGLIEIARKSGNKLNFGFEKLNETFSFFYLQTRINVVKNNDQLTTDEISIKNTNTLHRTLEDNKILLNFSGIFNQDKLISLLSIIDGHIRQKKVAMRNKVYNIMIELLQNIARHADDYVKNTVDGHYGIFFVSEHNSGFTFTAGNYIKKDKAEMLKAKIDSVNNLTQTELSKLHFQTMLSYKEERIDYIGLGITDMRIKSKNPFVYDFYPVDDEFDFYSLQVTITKRPPKMKKFEIEPTEDTPYVLLAEEKPVFLIKGMSYPENSLEFYKPVLEWLMKYSKNPKSLTAFEVRLKYYNTSTTKEFIKLLNIIEEISKKSAVTIKWYYDIEDEDAFALAAQFSKLINLDFQIIPFEVNYFDDNIL